MPDALISATLRTPMAVLLRKLARGIEEGRYVQVAGGIRVTDNGSTITMISDLKLLRVTSASQPVPSTQASGIRLCWNRGGAQEAGPWLEVSQEKYVRRACEGLNMMFGAGTHWVEGAVGQ